MADEKNVCAIPRVAVSRDFRWNEVINQTI
jgi:hypothetical protein